MQIGPRNGPRNAFTPMRPRLRNRANPNFRIGFYGVPDEHLPELPRVDAG